MNHYPAIITILRKGEYLPIVYPYTRRMELPGCANRSERHARKMAERVLAQWNAWARHGLKLKYGAAAFQPLPAPGVSLYTDYAEADFAVDTGVGNDQPAHTPQPPTVDLNE
jgi:hypothetical protein